MPELKNQRKIIFLVILSLVAIIFGFVCAYFYNYSVPDGQIIKGVKIGPVDVGEMTREDAAQKVASWSKPALAQKVQFNFEDRRWENSLADLGIGLKVEEALDEAIGVGRNDNVWKRYLDRAASEKEGCSIDLFYKFDEAQTASVIDKMTGDLTVKPVEAGITINDQNEVMITPEEPGSRIVSEAAAREIQAILEKGIIEPLTKKWNLTLRMTEIKPQITRASLEDQRINGLLASYSTSFATSNANRSYNIKVAAEALNNQLLKPGETFSFNQVVGPRSQEAGYKEAMVIVKNELVPGLGGGVCQVSTTLYNAVLRADLKVVERSNHSLPVSYVPAGCDATVTYGGRDFKFTNSTEGHLLLKTKIVGKTLIVQIYGDKKYLKEVNISSQVISTIEPRVITKPNPDLYEGKEIVEQQGKAGLKVQVNRTVKVDGQVVRRDLISADVYNPMDQIVQVGTKKNIVEPEGGTTKPNSGGSSTTTPGRTPGSNSGTTSGATPGANSEVNSENKPGTTPENHSPSI